MKSTEQSHPQVLNEWRMVKGSELRRLRLKVANLGLHLYNKNIMVIVITAIITFIFKDFKTMGCGGVKG